MECVDSVPTSSELQGGYTVVDSKAVTMVVRLSTVSCDNSWWVSGVIAMMVSTLDIVARHVCLLIISEDCLSDFLKRSFCENLTGINLITC